MYEPMPENIKEIYFGASELWSRFKVTITQIFCHKAVLRSVQQSRSLIMNKSVCGRVQNTEYRQRDRNEVDAHGARDYGFQCRRIVDSVTYHANYTAFHQCRDICRLFFGEQIGSYFADADLSCGHSEHIAAEKLCILRLRTIHDRFAHLSAIRCVGACLVYESSAIYNWNSA